MLVSIWFYMHLERNLFFDILSNWFNGLCILQEVSQASKYVFSLVISHTCSLNVTKKKKKKTRCAIHINHNRQNCHPRYRSTAWGRSSGSCKLLVTNRFLCEPLGKFCWDRSNKKRFPGEEKENRKIQKVFLVALDSEDDRSVHSGNVWKRSLF